MGLSVIGRPTDFVMHFIFIDFVQPSDSFDSEACRFFISLFGSHKELYEDNYIHTRAGSDLQTEFKTK